MSKDYPYFFNSLPDVYEALKKAKQEEKVESTVELFLKNSFNLDMKEKVKRFLEIPGIGFIPADMKYFKLYSELMQLYTNGLFYSTIVLSGVLCERICYDILSRQRVRIGDRELLEEQIACLYEMNLHYLIELLRNWGVIKEETKLEMIKVNNKRNEYVHPKKSEADAKKDSLRMIKMITKILANEFEVKSAPAGWVTLV